jgi:hypothetical protein
LSKAAAEIEIEKNSSAEEPHRKIKKLIHLLVELYQVNNMPDTAYENYYQGMANKSDSTKCPYCYTWGLG